MGAGLNACVGCLRWTVFVLNLFFWLAGLGILGVALWLRFDPAVGEYVMSINKDLEHYYTSLYLLMAAGIIMALFGFLGCFGALKLSPAMLTAFFILLVIVFCIELACGLVAYFHRDEIKTYFENSLADSIREKYGNDESITKLIDQMQSTFHCCGVQSYQNYRTSSFATGHKFPEMGIGAAPHGKLPTSCCNEHGIAMYKDKGTACGTDPDFENYAKANFSELVYTRGCSDAIMEQLQKNFGIIIGLAVGIGCIQLLGMCLSMLLCCLIGYRKQREYGKLEY